MKARCIKDFSVEKCDDNGFTIENSDVVVNRNSIWDIEEDSYRFIGGEIRLTNDEYGWLEIPKVLFEECFKIETMEFNKKWLMNRFTNKN